MSEEQGRVRATHARAERRIPDGMSSPGLRYDTKALAKLCRKHHVRRLDLFGSRAKGTAKDGSDVDLLVEFEPGHVPGLLGFLALQEDLADLLGEEVDLVSSGGLSPYMRDEILTSRSRIYKQNVTTRLSRYKTNGV